MSLRQMFAGSIVKPGFNPLGTQTPSYTYNLYSWGSNANGQLGLGNRTDYSSPKQVGALTDWSSVFGNSGGSYAIKTDGTLWTWGQNTFGQLGLGNTTYYSSPKQVGSLTNWLTLAAGRYYFALALKTNGTLWAWGSGAAGQLGQNNTTSYSSPIQIGVLTTWSYIAAGNRFSVAIKTDGTMWSWGRNNIGQLGIGNTTSYSSPKQIGALTTWLKIASLYETPIAIKTDGTIWGWGQNGNGQIGIGTTSNYSSPMQIGALTTWLSAASGSYNSLALRTNGTMWSWGYNQRGELGLGNSGAGTYRSSPTQVGSLTTWSKIFSNRQHCFAITTSGALWAWGENTSGGRLGLGNQTNYSSPVQVGTLNNWYTVGAGGLNTLALGY